MGLQESYLSKRINGKKQYNVDMVTVVSEKSLNSQMRLYLARCDWKITVYFLRTVDDNGNVELFMLKNDTDESKIPIIFELGDTVADLEEKGSSIYKELEKLNLFSLASGKNSKNEARVHTALNDYSLGFALRLEDGIPEEIIAYLAKNKGKVDPDEFLKIITVDPVKNLVTFKQFFKSFEIVQINIQVAKNKVMGILSSVKQECDITSPLKNLWSTTCSIAVDLREVPYEYIDNKAVSEKIKSMAGVPNPDTVFDISQLLLDLSTLQTVNPVRIDGIDTAVNSQIPNLISEYFNRLEKAGQTVFGHIVLPKPNMTVKYLFTPNVRNFAVSDAAFYYLINFDDSKKPDIPNLGNNKDFEWKPLLNNKVIADGAMAINATKFIPLIRSKFEPALQPFAMTKHAYVKAGAYSYSVKWDGDVDHSLQKFNVNIDEPWKADWSFTRQYTQEDQLVWAPPLPFPVASGRIDSEYRATCDTSFGTFAKGGITYPSYDFNLRIRGWMNYRYNSADNPGWYYDHSIKFQVGVKVDADGHFKLEKNVTNTDNKPGGIKIGGWGDFCSFGTLQGAVDNLVGELNFKIDELTKKAVDDFIEGVNTFTGWFLPGCRTFTYKNEGISNYGDFFTYVNYVQE
jgi:hypothetical protein